MATKIRLQRGGRKNYAFYSIVIADVRAPRDGKFTEKGAFDDAEAQKRFDAWKNGKDAKVSAVREGDAKAKKEAAAKELEAEKKMNEAIAKKVAEKKAAAAAAEAAAETEATEEAPAEA